MKEKPYLLMIEILDINDEKLDIFKNLSENQLAHIYEPAPGLFMAESLKVLERALNAGYIPQYALIEDKMLSSVSHLFKGYENLKVYVATFEVLTNLTGYHMTGGVLCAMYRKKLPEIDMILKNAKRIAVLEDVVNPTNIGSIFRNAAALGIDGIILSPGCCDPLYKRAIRVSMGTVFQIPWTFINKNTSWPAEGMSYLKSNGFKIAAMALDEKAISIKNKQLNNEEKLAILLGSEGNGLCNETLDLCDYTVMIPMKHGVDSLNVAAASALAFWELSLK